ncbi:MAG: molybdenum cofactor guanylyltransferase [Desulfurococcales archaeon]|nr:molybdenum cofactor guanylyltransferase [Desulfurococcales archaeon]
MPSKLLLVLAGGSGSRLGRVYKPLLDFGGAPIILRIISYFMQFVDEVVVSVGSKWQLRELVSILPCSVRIVTDVVTGYGPLAGIYTGLSSTVCDLTYIAPADMPCISLSTYLKLEEFVLTGYEAAVPKWPNGYVEPLNTVVISRVALKAVVKLLNAGVKKVSQLYTLLHTAFVPVHYLTSSPNTEFMNLNELKDLRSSK